MDIVHSSYLVEKALRETVSRLKEALIYPKGLDDGKGEG